MKRYGAYFFLLIFSSGIYSENIIAVLPFNGNDTSGESVSHGIQIAEHISSFIAGSDIVQVVERTQVSKIMQEIKLSRSDLVDENKAVEAGKLAGAQLVVIGNFSIKGPVLTVNARLVEVKTGIIKGAAIESGKKESDVLDNISIKILEYFGISVAYNSSYKVKKGLAISCLGLTAVSAGLCIWSHATYGNTDEEYETSFNLSQAEYDDLAEKAEFHKNARYYFGSGSAVLLGVGLYFLLSNRSEWVFSEKKSEVSIVPMVSPSGVGMQYTYRF